MNTRVVFLDYDGVVNTPIWNATGTSCRYGFPRDGRVNNFQAVQWISEFCTKCGYDIVVTSTWRNDRNYKECLINGGLREGISILGKTEDLGYQYSYPLPTRGYEIKKYLEDHPEITCYVIVDDEQQFLPEQQGHFVKIINDWVGFNKLEFDKCVEIYQEDIGHQHYNWTIQDEETIDE